MAKRKNPLQDIDAFLSQEATNLVTPNQVSTEKVKKTAVEMVPSQPASDHSEDMEKLLLQWAEKQGEDFRSPFYKIVLKTLEGLAANSAKDKMLINTLLYLQNPDSWKKVVKDYWS